MEGDDQVDTKLLNKTPAVSVTGILVALTLVTLAYYIVIFKWKRRRLVKLAQQLPGPPGLPIVGHVFELLGNADNLLNRLVFYANKYESLFHGWLGPVLWVIIIHPEDIQIVLNNSKALEKAFMYRFIKHITGTGLLTAEVDKWRKNRRMVRSAFTSRQLGQFIPIFNRHYSGLIEKLRPHLYGGQFDIRKYVSVTSMEIICETALGIDTKAMDTPVSEFHVAVSILFDAVYKRILSFWLYPDFIYNRIYGKRVKEACNKLKELPYSVLKQRKEEYKLKKVNKLNNSQKDEVQEGNTEFKRFMDIILEFSDAGGNFSDDYIIDEIVNIVMAGFETVELTICSCLLMLGMHQNIQDKLYEEIYRIFGNSDHQPSMEDLDKLTYQEQVINETMRLFPVVPLFAREATEDIQISKHTIPAGATIVIAPILLHRKPSIYPDPLKFNPENFTPERIAERHSYSFIPFSGGPRGCLGQKYAMLSMKTTVSTLLRSYRFFTDMKMEDINLTVGFVLGNINGLHMRIEPRKTISPN